MPLQFGPFFAEKIQQRLKMVQLLSVSNQVCRRYITRWFPKRRQVSDNYICGLGYQAKNRSICLGDSGGPFVCRNRDGRFELAGINSRLYECGQSPSVFSDVSYYFPWIHEKTGLRF